MVGSVNDKR